MTDSTSYYFIHILSGVCRAIFGRNRDTVGSGESLLSRRFALERVPWEGKGTDGAVLGCKVVAQKLFNNVVRFPKLPPLLYNL